MHQKQHWIVTGDVLFNYKHSGSIKMHAAYFKILIQNVYCKKLQFFVLWVWRSLLVCVWSLPLMVPVLVCMWLDQSGIAYLWWYGGSMPSCSSALSRPPIEWVCCMMQAAGRAVAAQSGPGLATALDSTLNTTQQTSYWSTNCQLFCTPITFYSSTITFLPDRNFSLE